MSILGRKGVACLIVALFCICGCGPGTVAVLVLAGTAGTKDHDDDDPKALQPPSGVSARSQASGEVIVEWAEVAGADSHNIYWDVGSGVTKASGILIPNVATPFVHSVPSNGTTYFYVVTAVRGADETLESQEASATPLEPPAGVSAQSDASYSASIAWNPVPGATTYTLYWDTLPGVTKATRIRIPAVSSPHVQSVPSNGVPYYFVVTAVNSDGGGAESTESSEWNVRPLEPPGAFSASAGPGEVTLQWSLVPGATGYSIYWSTSAGVTKVTGTEIAGVTSPHVHPNLVGGTTYFYVVTAGGPLAESSESAEVSATPAPPAPPPPTGVLASPGDSMVTIIWSPVGGADSYNIYWDFFPGVTKTTGVLIPGVTSPYNHTGLVNGTTYYYVVTADSIASGESGESVERSATPTAVQSFLYGAGQNGQRLVTIDPSTGLDLAIGEFGQVFIRGLAYDPDTDNLYGVSWNRIYHINQITGISTDLFTANTGQAEALAFDPSSNQLYVAEGSLGDLKTVDATTGQRIIIGPLSIGVAGLALHPTTNTLYGISWGSNSDLYEIDTSTAFTTLIGPIGSGLDIQGISFDPTTDTLYGVESFTDTLYTIDTATGVPTRVGAAGGIRVPDILGLAFKF